MEIGNGGLEELSRSECLRLLSKVRVGRVAFTVGALPSVLPVNFTLAGEDVVFRTDPGSKLDAAIRNAVVAFEADEVDDAAGRGWSVVVVGVASHVVADDELTELRALPLRPSGPGALSHYVRIAPQMVSGRRLPDRTADPCRSDDWQR